VLPDTGNTGTPDETAVPVRVAVMDLETGGREGLSFLRCLRRVMPELPILALSNGTGELGAFEALRAGASGHLYKPVCAGEVADAVSRMAAGETVLCQMSQQSIVRALWGSEAADEGAGLTPRQREVMSWLVLKLYDKEVADRMGTSEAMVHSQLEQIYRKLGVHDREGAVRAYLGVGA
jgi:DNA-binding NarL/FixJ family response regulator